MNRMSTGLCLAAAVGFAATLGAQSPTTTTSSRSTMDKEHDVTLTGCLSKATTGYTLTNAQVDTTASASTTTTPGSTTAGTTGTTGSSRDAAAAAATTWMLSGDSDLEKHVGHKIQVTGKTSWDASMDHARASGTTATPPSTTTATSASSSSTADPKLDVKSIKMVSSSCS